MTSIVGVPRLLVSVRDLEEAAAALAGGCDIVDIKEPRRGSLGMARIETIGAIVAAKRQASHAAAVPISAALGEMTDWKDCQAVLPLPRDLSYVKLGLAGADGRIDWRKAWRNARNRFDEAAGEKLNWIAVAYADWIDADAPSPQDVLNTAAEDNLAGLLIDTHSKTGGNLLDWLSVEEIGELVGMARSRGLIVALAGSIDATVLPLMATLPNVPDIVAVRTAVCAGGDRAGTVTSAAVRAFREALLASFTSSRKSQATRCEG